MQENKKKTVGIILAAIAFIAVVGTTYAFITRTLTGSKKVTITAGTLSLVLDEKNEITISDALPMYDEVGIIQEEVFKFNLINNTSNPTDYTLKLQKVSTTNELATSDVKYYLTKEGVGTPKLLSTLQDGVIDTGTIAGGDTIEYTLRLWISDAVTDKTAITGKSLSYKLAVEASMVEVKGPFVDTLEGKVDTTTTISFANISSETNGRGIYKYQEDGEDIYYWRGKVTDNHVIFAGYCWEMVRTTKTGGVKIIYDGTPVESNGVLTCPNTGAASALSVGNKVFNSSYNDNAYVGYMYGLTGVTAELSSPQCIKKNSAGTAAEVGIETTEAECAENGGKWATTAYESTHANVVNSKIKGVIDAWFSTSSLNAEENLEKIEDTVYCNDRRIDTTYETALGYGINATGYMARNRFITNSSTSIPDLSCSKNDSFTVSDENGNGDLTYPVGLITVDEMVLAGINYNASSNKDFYLYTGKVYWALSPEYFFITAVASEFGVGSTGGLSKYGMTNSLGVRPVISLIPGTSFASGGTGTESAPYVVE